MDVRDAFRRRTGTEMPAPGTSLPGELMADLVSQPEDPALNFDRDAANAELEAAIGFVPVDFALEDDGRFLVALGPDGQRKTLTRSQRKLAERIIEDFRERLDEQITNRAQARALIANGPRTLKFARYRAQGGHVKRAASMKPKRRTP